MSVYFKCYVCVDHPCISLCGGWALGLARKKEARGGGAGAAGKGAWMYIYVCVLVCIIN